MGCRGSHFQREAPCRLTRPGHVPQCLQDGQLCVGVPTHAGHPRTGALCSGTWARRDMDLYTLKAKSVLRAPPFPTPLQGGTGSASTYECLHWTPFRDGAPVYSATAWGLGKGPRGARPPECLSGENEAGPACFRPLGSESRTHPPGPQSRITCFWALERGLPWTGLFLGKSAPHVDRC